MKYEQNDSFDIFVDFLNRCEKQFSQNRQIGKEICESFNGYN